MMLWTFSKEAWLATSNSLSVFRPTAKKVPVVVALAIPIRGH
jgi:hypothetical protein